MADIAREDLGRKYRDPISGWEGTATARYDYLNGCVRIEISGADKDGKPEAFVFDEGQLLPIDDAGNVVSVKVHQRTRKVGGPRSNRPVAR